jgi:hypothetical protein
VASLFKQGLLIEQLPFARCDLPHQNRRCDRAHQPLKIEQLGRRVRLRQTGRGLYLKDETMKFITARTHKFTMSALPPIADIGGRNWGCPLCAIRRHLQNVFSVTAQPSLRQRSASLQALDQH